MIIQWTAENMLDDIIIFTLGSLSSASCGEATPPDEGGAVPSPSPLDCGEDGGVWRGSTIVNLRDIMMHYNYIIYIHIHHT